MGRALFFQAVGLGKRRKRGFQQAAVEGSLVGDSIGPLDGCPTTISQVVGSPDRKGQEKWGWGGVLYIQLGHSRSKPKAAGSGWTAFSPFLELPFHIWSPAACTPGPPNPNNSCAHAPPPLFLPTHAEHQQKNVEQELDTFHSSFHRHGCWAWGR